MSTRRFVKGSASPAGDPAGQATVEPEFDALFAEFGEQGPPVAIVVATREEREKMREAEQELTSRGIQFNTHELSPHRNAALLAKFAETAAMRGVRVIIAAAGLSAALPSILAAYTDIPVIGVPFSDGPLSGLDTLLATAQMPPGVPVACMSLDGTRNAAVFASHILNAIPLPPPSVE